ncbi:uncharacterized protein PITG_15074 [Phytophthora infestans T30-4]|uniref:Uncharacterized protein n=1 Tax=Phytophthora infestans (strain T30-4) TaxID=403677 RepID=D0NRL1_PHYIT|nr:uncharacterized protein PITG_15074 [Phytophthora infestans T30-4]EEY63361.1 conserved hypothetical protein [Phytophthora infestans T30-4]|eukprot:XP_002898246.1 conserved hypothetical protein [Phytophthora infestans T30-4]
MQSREALANRLLYGDLTRLVTSEVGTTRPATFLDFIFAIDELSDALKSHALAGSQLFASTLIPYVFRYLNVDVFPRGNPALPDAVADTATLLAAISEDAMNAQRRKTQRFQYDPEGYTTAIPTDVAYPSTVNLSKDLTGVFTTTVYWANTLSQEFWLESAESIAPVSWNLFPSISFFTDDTAISATLPAPIVAVTLHSSSSSPLNVVVRHQSRLLRNGATDKVNKLLLHLEFGIAEVTEKSADGCAHCRANEPGCAPLKTCLFSAIQNPIAQLQQPQLT